MTINRRDHTTRPIPDTRRRTLADRVVTWVGWHMGELLAVTLTLALAVAVSAWFLLAAGLLAAAWCAHELRLWRCNQAVLATRPPAADTDETDLASA